MATRKPLREKATKPKRRSNAEGLIELLREIGPQHELADAIQSVYEERHRKPSSNPGGQRKRRRLTRT